MTFSDHDDHGENDNHIDHDDHLVHDDHLDHDDHLVHDDHLGLDDDLDHGAHCWDDLSELEVGGYLTRCARTAASIALNS